MLPTSKKIKYVYEFDPKAEKLIRHIKEKGFHIALATNPLFPSVATESRIQWAGLNPDDFELYATYETSRYFKPNLDHYREVLNQLGVFLTNA